MPHGAGPAATATVAVVGSANLDLVVSTAHPPLAGETVLADSYGEFSGGKGLNQARAAAKLQPTALIGAVGEDSAGEKLTGSLRSAGVITDQLHTVAGSSGIAIVQLSADGENRITVITGANGSLSRDHVEASLTQLNPAVVLTQLESPIAAVQASAEWADANGRRWVFNPSPVSVLSDLPPGHPLAQLVSTADPLIVNEGEARSLLPAQEAESLSFETLAEQLSAVARSVVVTAGAGGAWVAVGGEVTHVSGERVTAVDTTGAGDCFAGTLAGHLAAGDEMISAAGQSVRAASTLVSTSRDARE